MEKLNLWELDDEDIEFFCDTINENTVSGGELLAVNGKKDLVRNHQCINFCSCFKIGLVNEIFRLCKCLVTNKHNYE